MILIDFGNLSARLLFGVIGSVKPKKVNGKYITRDYLPLVKHLSLVNLIHAKKTFGKKEEIVVCCDRKGSWRKDFYPDYKANRVKDPNDPVDYVEFYAAIDRLCETLKECFPVKVMDISKAEADDCIAVLSKLPGQHTIVSSDKDFVQLFRNPSVRIYDPLKKQYVKRPEDVEKKLLEHILLGDASDNIPKVVSGSEFSPSFLSYLKQNNIYTEKVLEFFELSISEKLLAEYNIKKIIKQGKLKGQESSELDIFKSTNFGEKACKSFIEDLETNLDKNPVYRKNYERNKVLISFDYIPEELAENIRNSYYEQTLDYNLSKMLEYCQTEDLREIQKEISLLTLELPESNRQVDLDSFF